ncbi:hypothetical protein CASFOL_038422 [Castilleja foliolosa]|uniref:RRM domain-containing protein n=1 Tax=Castilleja foliolosa TaxID=1961234 RepID=A0ABD3BM66_9LAMI
MATSALNHRILPNRFLTLSPPTSAASPLVSLTQIEAKSRFRPSFPSLISTHTTLLYTPQPQVRYRRVTSCLSSSSSSSSTPTTPRFTPSNRLFVSGLSFRTTEESLRNAFKCFGELVEVNLVMDKMANRPRGFAFLSYASAEESTKAIEGMHGKFLDGRVIFVEIAKSMAELRKGFKQSRYS